MVFEAPHADMQQIEGIKSTLDYDLISQRTKHCFYCQIDLSVALFYDHMLFIYV